MKYIKLFEEYKVDNFTKQDIIDTIENDGKIKVFTISDLPEHNPDNYIRPVDIDGDSIIVDIDGQQYRTRLEYVTKMEYSNLNESIITDDERESILSSPDGFNSREDAEEHLDYFIEHELGDMKGTIRLFRVVFIEDGQTINENDLGRHWTHYELDDDDIDTIRRTMDSQGEPYIIVADFNKSDVDIFYTLKTQILYPHENEFHIKDGANPIKYKIYKFEDIEKMNLNDFKQVWRGNL